MLIWFIVYCLLGVSVSCFLNCWVSWCLLFIDVRWLFVVFCVLFDGCCVWLVVRLLFVFVVCCSWFVVGCLFFACSESRSVVVGCLLLVVCCLLSVV